MARAGLTSDAVIEAATRMLDEQADETLSLAALAERLGVRPPSLYKHVDGAPAILRAILLRAKADLARTLADAAVGRSGDDAIRAMAPAYRAWAKRHPSQYRLATRAPVPGDDDDERVSAELLGVVSTIIAGYGLSGDAEVHAIRYLRATLHGFVALETGGAFALPTDLDASFERVVDTITAALGAVRPA